MPSRSTSAWAASALAGLVLLGRCSVRFTTALEVIDSVVDRDGGTLFVEDILEGFGRVPVSVDFSPVTDHMFIGFKAGGVRNLSGRRKHHLRGHVRLMRRHGG